MDGSSAIDALLELGRGLATALGTLAAAAAYQRRRGRARPECGGERGDVDAAPLEVKIELPFDAHIPHDYVPEERLRLEAYRGIATAVNDADVDAVSEELVDRYGSPPPAVETLLAVARLRVRARAAELGAPHGFAAAEGFRKMPV